MTDDTSERRIEEFQAALRREQERTRILELRAQALEAVARRAYSAALSGHRREPEE